ncbi:MAG: ATP-dependent helicase HrpB [Polyangiaceae bacterium]
MLDLPIDAAIPRVLAAFREARAVVVDAAPGAGKTTRVPSALLDAVPGDKKVLVLEPRRIAAKMAALRVASERGERPGERVGYAMRFEEQVGPETRLVFMTEGVLTRRLLRDPMLADVGAVVLDEVHERHLEGDLALALLLHLRATRRPDLPLVAMSATIEAERFAARLGGAPVVKSEGRMFDVTIEHAERTDSRDLALRVVSAVRRAVEEGPPGDVLVFLPGAAEIRGAMDALGPLAKTADLRVLPLHGSLSIEEQTAAIRPSDRRKVVLATNVAESSLTIDGVVTVVDSGLANVASHSPWTGLPLLKKSPVSKASLAQRAGRAGRTREGRCLRLFTRGDMESRPDFDAPEIARADLAFAVLLLAAAGARDPAALPWLDAPPAQAVLSAMTLLGWLGALDEKGRLTAVGRRMLDFPLHPRLARVVAEAEALGVGRDGAAVAALLGERDLVASSFREGPRTAHALGRDGTHSDVLAALETYRGRNRDFSGPSLSQARVAAVSRAEKQIAGALRRSANDSMLLQSDRDERLRQALLMGFPDRVGRLRRPSNDTRRSEREILFASGGTAALAAESGVEGVDLVIAVDAEERHEGRGPRTLVRAASAIEADWLLDRFLERIDDRMDVEWNQSAERAEVVRRLMFEGLALEEKAARPEGEALVLASRELARAAKAKGWRAFAPGDEIDRFLLRVRFANKHCPDAGLPEIGEAEIESEMASLCEGKRSFSELRAADLPSAIRNLVPPGAARKLAEIAPDAVVLPGGRKAKVTYIEGQPPFVESRLQDFFGMKQGPSAAMGRVPIVLHLLAPNHRAVQVTTDLAGFWERHYPAIAKELRRKYPRHAWPDDPLTASPPIAGRPR